MEAIDALWDNTSVYLITSTSQDWYQTLISTEDRWRSHDSLLKQCVLTHGRQCWTLVLVKNAGSCLTISHKVGTFLDHRHHEQAQVWGNWNDRNTDKRDRKLENQWKTKAVQFLFREDYGQCIPIIDAAAGLDMNIVTILLDSLHRYMEHQSEECINKRRLHMGLNWEDLSWLVAIIRVHFVISVLTSSFNIDNRNYVIVKVYYFHLVRPPDNILLFIYICKN